MVQLQNGTCYRTVHCCQAVHCKKWYVAEQYAPLLSRSSRKAMAAYGIGHSCSLQCLKFFSSAHCWIFTNSWTVFFHTLFYSVKINWVFLLNVYWCNIEKWRFIVITNWFSGSVPFSLYLLSMWVLARSLNNVLLSTSSPYRNKLHGVSVTTYYCHVVWLYVKPNLT